MLNTERLPCKGVNPFCSHLKDKTPQMLSPGCHLGEKKPAQKPAFPFESSGFKPLRLSFRHLDRPPLWSCV